MPQQQDSNKLGIGCLIILGIIVLLGLLFPSDKSADPRGKPSDMPQESWEYTNRRLQKERPNESKDDIEDASRAIWEFSKQNK